MKNTNSSPIREDYEKVQKQLNTKQDPNNNTDFEKFITQKYTKAVGEHQIRAHNSSKNSQSTFNDTKMHYYIDMENPNAIYDSDDDIVQNQKAANKLKYDYFVKKNMIKYNGPKLPKLSTSATRPDLSKSTPKSLNYKIKSKLSYNFNQTTESLQPGITISDTKPTLHIITTTAPENFNTQETKDKEVISALSTERKSPPDSPNAISYRASLKSISKLDRSFRREEEMIKKVNKICELRQEDTDIFGNERLFATETKTKLTENGSLVRFVDNMILNGGLPTEAIQFFHPEGKGKSVTSPERKKIDPIDNVPNLIIIDAKGRRKIKRMNPKLDVIPAWLRSNTDYKAEYNNRPPKNRTPLMDILDRDPELKRENSDIQILAKFLGTLDMFINFPWNALEKLSHKIRGIKCDEGQFLCHEGDLADGLFIIYSGGLNIVKEESGFLLGTGEKNDIIGKKSANEPMVRRYRTAALIANKESYIVSLSFNDYEEIAREFSDLQFSQNKLHDYFFHHPFFSNFQESKLIHLISRSTPQKVYKNDVIYKMGDEANFLYIFLKGNVVREVPVKREKTNQWPTAMKGWKVNTILQNYTIVLPLEPGEIFGIREIVYAGRRQEKVLVLDDSFIISINKEDFNSTFRDESDIYRFKRKSSEDNRRKETKIKEILDDREQVERLKIQAIQEAYHRKHSEKDLSKVFRNGDNKLKNWIYDEKKKFDEETGVFKKPQKYEKIIREVNDNL